MSDNTQSLIRTSLKIGGAVLTTSGVLSADQVGVLGTAIMDVIGAASMLYGVYLSYNTHK